MAILKKAAILERYQMGVYHISKGTSEANVVQNLVLLTKFEHFLLKTAGLVMMYVTILIYLFMDIARLPRCCLLRL